MPLDSVVADLPLPLGGGSAVGVAPSDVDVLVDRTPFWLAIDKDNPYQRETAQFTREQVDQQPEAGEQSLAGWWTRSQMSFHYGAGLDYLDTTARPAPEDRLRFKTSRNVDVWTPGVVKRLHGTTLTRTASAGERVWADVTDGYLIIATATKVETWNGTSWTTRNYGTVNPIRAFAIDGSNYYVATIDGVWSAPISGTATATKVWNLPSTDVPMCLGWVKQRLILGHGAALYVLEGTGPALPTVKYTHPVSSWTWSAFTDGPSSMLACGYAGLQSGILSFGITDVSGTPTVGGGVPLISMPGGERIRCALFYVGSLLVLGTNRGVRVCTFDSFSNSATLGPLSVDTDGEVTALGGYDRYVWAGTIVGTETSLVRLDLSAPLDQAGHYAWAPDLVFSTTWTEAPTAVTFRSDGLKAIGVTGRGLVFEDATSNASEAAWLQTARIRMGTVEDKHWLYGTVRGTYSAAVPIGISVTDPAADGEFTTVHVTGDSTERFGLRARSGEWIALRFDFADGAELSSYQVQALPGGYRQRLVAIPVWLADYQITRSGQAVGYEGWALERLADLEGIEFSGGEVTITAPTLFTEAIRGVIERLQFAQVADPGDQDTPGTSGRLLIVLRTTS